MYNSQIISCNNLSVNWHHDTFKQLISFCLILVLIWSTVLAQSEIDSDPYQKPSQSLNNNHMDLKPSPDQTRPQYDAPNNVEDRHHSHGHGIGEELDEEHMKQHNSDEFVDFSKLSQGEIAMHHFRQFDLDANGRVDGLEVLKKIQKDAREDGNENFNVSDTLVNIVDNAMDQYDENRDGYIHYAEFYKVYKKL